MVSSKGASIRAMKLSKYELKTSESGEDGACRWRWMSAFLVGSRSRFEFNVEIFEVGQHGQASGDRLG
jgi:hypothetical protein